MAAITLDSIPIVDRPIGKKMVIACDGTWQNSDAGPDEAKDAIITSQIVSNVPRIVRALNHKDEHGIPQIVYYQRGIGADGDLQDSIQSGITGQDISEHIREAYAFVANNFDPISQKDLMDPKVPMDQIVVLGFSRGAYTARCIASLISDVGLLTKIGMESFWGIFKDWMMQNVPGRQSEWFESVYGKKIAFSDPAYRKQLIDDKLTRWGMPIRACCVFDTVGSLGIPLPFDSKNVKPYSFVNTKVAQSIQFAFHALAIDEKRHFFTPTLWEWPEKPNRLQKLKQVWFPGCHSNIGGSYPDAGISNISLAWMISQLEDNDKGILSFNPDYLDWVQDSNIAYYNKQTPKEVRPWGFGKLYNSSEVTDIKTLAISLLPIVRTPGAYTEVDPQSGLGGKIPLKQPNEFVHRCVRVRIDGGGLGEEEHGVYKPEALKDYTIVESPQVKAEKDHSAVSSGVVWQAKDGRSLPEDTLGATEIRLLKRYVGLVKG